jgi:phosphate:Na+ symporter
MVFPVTLINLFGFIALLLWGMHMVQTGVQRTFGSKLRSALGKALKTRLRAFFAGLGVTAILQSSTATGLMVAGFAAGGLVDLTAALAVMLGANVGTTLIVQVFSFDVASVSPALIFIGVLLFRRDSTAQTHDLGRVFIGFGLMLLALHQLLDLITPYEDAPSLRLLLGAISTTPLLDVFIAAGVTWAAHSSVAIVLVVMSLASKGIVPPEAAFALVLGANLGTAINPVLEGTRGNDPFTKRLPMGNLINRLVGVLLGLALLHPIVRLLVTIEPDNARAVADFHMMFNVILAVVFLPFLKVYARLLQWCLPARIEPADPSQPLYLNPAARSTPIVALGAAAREALRLADVLEIMLLGTRDALMQGDRRLIGETKRLDDVIDHLNTAIRSYLTSLDSDQLGEADHRRLEQILTFAMNMEQAGDAVERNLLPHASKRVKRGLTFSTETQAELSSMMDRLIVNLHTAASLFMTEDPRAARILAHEKTVFRDFESAATRAHFERLRAGQQETTEARMIHLDLIRDMKLVNSHLVAAAAYPVLERSGELLPSRIATTGSSDF